jgi:hypothetical protein
MHHAYHLVLQQLLAQLLVLRVLRVLRVLLLLLLVLLLLLLVLLLLLCSRCCCCRHQHCCKQKNLMNLLQSIAEIVRSSRSKSSLNGCDVSQRQPICAYTALLLN